MKFIILNTVSLIFWRSASKYVHFELPPPISIHWIPRVYLTYFFWNKILFCQTFFFCWPMGVCVRRSYKREGSCRYIALLGYRSPGYIALDIRTRFTHHHHHTEYIGNRWPTYISIYCDIVHQNKFFLKYPSRSFIEETLHWIYLPSACILIILLRFLRTAENVNEMVRVTIWPFGIWVAKPAAENRRRWENFWHRSPAIAKRSSSYKFTTNLHSSAGLAGFIGRFPPIWYWQFKTGLFVVVFMTPSCSLFCH